MTHGKIHLKIDRNQASERGLPRFYTGDPCNQGHICERLVSSGRCVDCLTAKRQRYRSENPEKSWKSAVNTMQATGKQRTKGRAIGRSEILKRWLPAYANGVTKTRRPSLNTSRGEKSSAKSRTVGAAKNDALTIRCLHLSKWYEGV